jgi:hypothetical protein
MRPETNAIYDLLFGRSQKDYYEMIPNFFLTSHGHLIIFNPDIVNFLGVLHIHIIRDYAMMYHPQNVGTIYEYEHLNESSYDRAIEDNPNYMGSGSSLQIWYRRLYVAKFLYWLKMIDENKLKLSHILEREAIRDKDIKMFTHQIANNKVYTPLVINSRYLSNMILIDPTAGIKEDNVIDNYDDADLLYDTIMNKEFNKIKFVGMKDGRFSQPIEFITTCTDCIVYDRFRELRVHIAGLVYYSEENNLWEDVRKLRRMVSGITDEEANMSLEEFLAKIREKAKPVDPKDIDPSFNFKSIFKKLGIDIE